MADNERNIPGTSTSSDTPCSSRIARKAYKVRDDIDTAQICEPSPTNMPSQVCHACANPLSRVQQAFSSLRRQGTEIKRRQAPKNPNRLHYRNLVLQNEWLRVNVFDAMGNYLFCQRNVSVLHFT